MHEGDHGILDHVHEPDHEHNHQLDASRDERRARANRVVAMVIVAAGVALFVLWRLL
jgi:hypothetical protein